MGSAVEGRDSLVRLCIGAGGKVAKVWHRRAETATEPNQAEKRRWVVERCVQPVLQWLNAFAAYTVPQVIEGGHA
jgi:hypothetical protein